MADTDESDLATRLAKLESDLKAEREENAAHRDTLKALEAQQYRGGGDRRVPPNPMARLSREDAQGLAEELGGEWTPALVQQNYAVIEAMFRHAARPVMNGLQGMADVLDLVHTRQELPDFKDLESEATKVRDEHVSRGQFITRKQAAAIVKSRRMEDPKYQDEMADRRLKERETEAARREAEQTAATTEGTGRAATQSAGPSATKSPKAPLDKESFERAPLEEKRKILDESGIAF